MCFISAEWWYTGRKFLIFFRYGWFHKVKNIQWCHENPDNLIKYVEEPDEDFIADLYENEDFFLCCRRCLRYKKMTWEYSKNCLKSIWGNLTPIRKSCNYNDEDYPKLKLTWCEKVPKSMKKICPKLFERFYIGENEYTRN